MLNLKKVFKIELVRANVFMKSNQSVCKVLEYKRKVENHFQRL